MKKTICFVLLFALLGCLSACTFTQNLSGSLAGDSEATPKVQEMMQALAENRSSDALALMHPQVADKSDNAIAQMSSFLNGREASSIEMKTINVNTSKGVSGKSRQEQVTYQVTLADGDIIYISAAYLTDNDGNGFSSFQLVLGIV